MPEGRINLEESLGDSPQVRADVSKLEKYLSPLKEYTTLLRDTFQACSHHQGKVCEGTDALAKLLTSFQGETMGDQETFVPKAFFRLSRYLSELHSCQDMLSTQLQNAVIELLSQFLSTDFGNLERLREQHEAASQEHEQAAIKFSRLSKKKDSEKTRFEANADLFAARRKFYESSLDYHTELNCFQHKKKFAILEPILTFMHAQMAYFKVGHEILSRELGNLLTDLNTDVQRVHEDYQREVLTSNQTREDIKLRFPTLCQPDPDPTDPFIDPPILPDTTLTSKSGYLFIRTATGFPSKWERVYFFTKKGYFYIHIPPKSPELVINLKGAEAAPTEIDDRRYAFTINHSSLKRPMHLLAESDIQKDEWISVINNIAYDKGHLQPRSNTKRDEAVIKLEREKIRSWVKKEIDPKVKEKANQIPKIPKASPTPPTTTPTTTPASSFPSLPSFLNFLDPSNQSNQSDGPSSNTTTPKKTSPLFPRKPSTTPKSGNDREGVLSPQSPQQQPGVLSSLPSPLQPERLTTGSSTNTRPPLHYSRNFCVKYLGHMEVPEGRNISLITETIQKVMSARVLRSVKEAQAIEMSVTNRSICLYDHNAKKAIGQILLRDILRCAVQHGSVKLFGIVNRTTGEGDKNKFICHVMEAETTGSQVCAAINEAIQAAIRIMQTNKHMRSKSSGVSIQQQASKNQVDGSPATSSLPPSGITPPTRPPSKLLPKQKSASESQLSGAGREQVLRPTLPSSSVSSSQSSLSSDESSLDWNSTSDRGSATGPSFAAMPALLENQVVTSQTGLTGVSGGNSTNYSFLTSQGSPATNGPSGIRSGGWSSQGAATPPQKPLPTSAITSSDYYPMPGTLPEVGGAVSSDTRSNDHDADRDEMDSPLPPLDDFIGSSLSAPTGGGSVQNSLGGGAPTNGGGDYYQMPGTVGAGFGSFTGAASSGSSHSASNNFVAANAGSASTTPTSSNSKSSADTSSSKTSSFQGLFGSTNSADSGSSYVLPANTSNTNGGGVYGLPQSVNGGGSILDTLSSSESIFNVSSSSSAPQIQGDEFPLSSSLGGETAVDSGYLPPPMAPQQQEMGGGFPQATTGGDIGSPADSGYLPPPQGPDFPLATTGGDITPADSGYLPPPQGPDFPLATTGGDGTPADSGYLPPPMAPTTPFDPSPSVPLNVSSSSNGGGSFPGPFQGGGVSTDEDFDEFELPPLPDSMEPSEGGVAGYGDMGHFVGSIVTLGTPRTQQN